MPSVSIVLPTRNRPQFLTEAVDSIRAQTLDDFELIIVDDASQPETAHLIAELVESDKRFKRVTNPFQRGVAASLNVGFDQATGDYLTWTSDDNIYRHSALEVMAKMIRGQDFVYSDMTLIDDMGLVIGHQKAHSSEELLLRNVVGSCFLYTRAVSQKVGAYDDTLRLVEDWEYWVRVAKAGFKMKAIPDDLYECRMHMGSELEHHRSELNTNTEIVLRRHLSTLPEPHHTACTLHLALMEWSKGHKKQAKQLGRKAMNRAALKFYKRELSDAMFGPGTSSKWTKTSQTGR